MKSVLYRVIISTYFDDTTFPFIDNVPYLYDSLDKAIDDMKILANKEIDRLKAVENGEYRADISETSITVFKIEGDNNTVYITYNAYELDELDDGSHKYRGKVIRDDGEYISILDEQRKPFSIKFSLEAALMFLDAFHLSVDQSTILYANKLKETRNINIKDE